MALAVAVVVVVVAAGASEGLRKASGCVGGNEAAASVAVRPALAPAPIDFVALFGVCAVACGIEGAESSTLTKECWTLVVAGLMGRLHCAALGPPLGVCSPVRIRLASERGESTARSPPAPTPPPGLRGGGRMADGSSGCLRAAAEMERGGAAAAAAAAAEFGVINEAYAGMAASPALPVCTCSPAAMGSSMRCTAEEAAASSTAAAGSLAAAGGGEALIR